MMLTLCLLDRATTNIKVNHYVYLYVCIKNYRSSTMNTEYVDESNGKINERIPNEKNN